MATVTVTDLVAQVRFWADMEHTNFVEDDKIIYLLNLGRKELTALLIRHSLIFNETVDTITPDGSAEYDMPADFFATIDVFRETPHDPEPLTYMDSSLRALGNFATGIATSYRPKEGALELYPVPSSGTYYHVYVPEPEMLTSSDSVNYPMGWEQYMVFYATQACLAKEETANPVVSGEMERLRERIKDEGASRNLKRGHAIGRLTSRTYRGRDGSRY